MASWVGYNNIIPHFKKNGEEEDDEEFEEADVWAVLEDRDDYSSASPTVVLVPAGFKKGEPYDTSSSTMVAGVGIPQPKSRSAPEDIPVCRKIYMQRLIMMAHQRLWNYEIVKETRITHWSSSINVDDDDDGEMMIPPHEFIAKNKRANTSVVMSAAASFSVLQGAGRTLKGRDLFNFRNAVLFKTGFIE